MIQQVVPLYTMLVTRHLKVGRRRLYLVLGSMFSKGYYYTRVHTGGDDQGMNRV